MKRIVIIGGGYAGTMLARALDAVADVTLVEPREAFVHNVGAIRAVVDPAILESLILLYDRLLKRGQVVRDRAISIEATSVKLASGQNLDADIIVVATGSTYASPFKPIQNSMTAFRRASGALHEQLTAAERIAIIGAGAVGVELAGEIASAMPGKRIILVSANPSLFPEFHPGLGQRLARDLKSLGVTVHLGVRAEGFDSAVAESGAVTLSNGVKIDADLIVPVLGAHPNVDVMAGAEKYSVDQIGRIMVDSWLRPLGHDRLFAIGDVAACGDMMTIVAVSRQAPWLAKTIKELLAGKSIEKLPAYRAWSNPPILIPLGAKRGASVLPITKNGLVVGGRLTAAIKGKKLFVPRYQKEFGLA